MRDAETRGRGGNLDEPGDTGPVEVGRVLAAVGLVTAFGHVSRRTSTSTFEVTVAGDLGDLSPGQTVEVALAATELPPTAPREAWVHLEVYRARPDVGAVVRAQPPSSFAVGAITRELRPLHGQAAWLGDRVPVHPVPRLLRTPDLARAAALSLGSSSAVILRGNGAVTVGRDVEAAAARMSLLSAACTVHLSATAAGVLEPLAPQDVAAWAAVAEEMLPRVWANLRRTAGRC